MTDKPHLDQPEPSTSNRDHAETQVPPELSFDITLKYESVRGFIREVSPLVCSEGMFLQTDSNAAVGSTVSFQMLVGDNFNLGKGTGIVAWRGQYTGADGDISGLALRFMDIDFSTRALVQRVVEQWSKIDGIPFRIESYGAGPEPELGTGAEEESQIVSPSMAIELPADLLEEDFSDAAEETPVSSKSTPGLKALLGWKNSKLRQLVEEPIGEMRRDLNELDEPVVEADVSTTAGAAEAGDTPAAQQIQSVEMPNQDEIFEYEEAELDEDFDFYEQGPTRSRGYLYILAAILLLLIVAGLLFKADLLRFVDSLKSKQINSAPDRGQTLPKLALAESDEPEDDLGGKLSATTEGELAEATSVTALTETDDKTLAISDKKVSITNPNFDSAVAPAGVGRSSIPFENPNPDVLAPDKKSQQPVTAYPEVLTAVDKISSGVSEGRTVLSIQGNGSWPQGSYKVYRIGDRSRPRQLLKIYGIAAPSSQTRLVVGSAQVHQVRIGHHPEFNPPELHVVADLAGIGVKLEDVSLSGRRLELSLTDR